ncbi:phospholipase D-like domain-containing protein [Roseateles koreensis]|uniref:Phospholipase D-like domain-containing protein n=1 Tax=Roseateles koreensis TaxID=2987526 RepID=A0ABT5KST5_9BURK|nr:hypothetical protein [Roseateles koreensis]MDC8785984.1 hypothetical protein [Roseateles koreensis]
MSLESVLEVAARARSGYDLVSFKEAGLPVFVLRLRILVLERKPISPIDEAVLRAVRAGLTAPASIYEFLGLPKAVLTPVLVALNTTELINYSRGAGDSDAKVTLSTKGRNALAEASTIKPQERPIEVCFDALTKRLLLLPPEQLLRGRDMRDHGLFEVPIGTSKRPDVEDIPLQDFDKVLERHASLSPDWNGSLLAIRRIERRELRYLACAMLFYKSTMAPHDVQIGFWREDGQSIQHEVAFAAIGGPELIGARTLPEEILMPPEVSLSESSAVSEGGSTFVNTGAGQVSHKVSSAPQPPEVETMQTLLCHEHPAHLKKALLLAKKRLVIVSPWIRDSVIDWGFISSLEALLRNGVEVHIGFGIEKADGPKKNAANEKADITPGAERDLGDLADRFKNFHFVYVGNTHRKSLVCDDQFAVVTSFNWLSYKGDSKGRPRDERGLLFRKKQHVEKLVAEELELLSKGTRIGRKVHGR